MNQLLTQLDGVEGRESVFVLAVSSRPDLIDPALLRPGRLDRLVFVGLPDEKSRIEVLRLASTGAHQHSNVNLELVAKRTENFSGADLHALAHNARLLAAHERLESTVDEKKQDQASGEAKTAGHLLDVVRGDHTRPERAVIERVEGLLGGDSKKTAVAFSGSSAASGMVTVEQRHWEQAVSELRPSVSEQDRRKLAAIYAQFQQSKRGADFKAGLEEGGPKQTLK